MLADGRFTHTNTAPQEMVNAMLSSMNIEYENEHVIDGYAIDNYLPDTGLAIEVMGDFWHCSAAKYQNISYGIQRKNVARDRIKRHTIQEETGHHVLYLWEDDVVNHPDLCMALVRLYLASDGILRDYNSFNYHIVADGVEMNDSIIEAYQDMPRSKYQQYIKA